MVEGSEEEEEEETKKRCSFSPFFFFCLKQSQELPPATEGEKHDE